MVKILIGIILILAAIYFFQPLSHFAVGAIFLLLIFGTLLIVRGVKETQKVAKQRQKSAIKEIRDQSREVDRLIERLKQLRGLKAEAARIEIIEALAKIGEPAVAPLIIALKHSDMKGAKTIIATLVKIGPLAVEPLIAALQDGYVMVYAMEALGEIGDARAVEPLIAALKEEDVLKEDILMQSSIKSALVKIGQPVVEPLVVMLQDKSSVIRYAAACILDEIKSGQLGWQPANSNEKIVYLVAHKQWDECVKFGKPAVESLIAVLEDEDADVSQQAAEALGKTGQPAVEPLIAALDEHVSPNVRTYAATALGMIGDARAVEPLIAALKDGDSHVRGWVAYTLHNFKGDKQVVEPLIAALKDEDGTVRKYAAATLRKIGDERALDPLIAVLNTDENSEVRQVALGMLRDTRAVEPLIAAFIDDNSKVDKDEVAEALGALGDKRAVGPLIAALKKDKHRIHPQWSIVSALGWIGDEQAVLPLIAVLKSGHSAGATNKYGTSYRETIRYALVDIGQPAVEPLIAVLQDKRASDVWVHAAYALGKIGDARAVEPLSAMLNHENLFRNHAASALDEIKAKKFKIKHQAEMAKIEEIKRQLSQEEMDEVIKEARRICFDPNDEKLMQNFINTVIETKYLKK